MTTIWVFTMLLCPISWPADRCQIDTADRVVEGSWYESLTGCKVFGPNAMSIIDGTADKQVIFRCIAYSSAWVSGTI